MSQQCTVRVKSVLIELRRAASVLKEWGRWDPLTRRRQCTIVRFCPVAGVCVCERVTVTQPLSSPTGDRARALCSGSPESRALGPLFFLMSPHQRRPLWPPPQPVALILPLSILSCCIIFLQWTHQLLIFCFLFPHFGCKPCENRGFVLPSAMSPALRTAPDTYQDSRNMDIYRIMCK